MIKVHIELMLNPFFDPFDKPEEDNDEDNEVEGATNENQIQMNNFKS